MQKTLPLAIVLAGAIAGWCFQPGEIPEFARAHKYFGDDRKEFTYTITSVMQFAKPVDVADMTDDYQDARLVSQDRNSVTVEITYYPLNTNREGIAENANWKRDYAHMTKYLAPTPTENWDEKMRADLLADLRRDGIEPDRMTDREVVTAVSRWLKRRSQFSEAFGIWYVHYPNGVPEVFPQLRPAFDREKAKMHKATDQALFDEEVLGKSMYYGRVHGSCTSYAVYLATVLRALGLPTRIVFCVPPVDGNDPAQKNMLVSAIHHNGVRTTVKHGLPRGGFSNHLFNEVFVGNRWVRVNYDVVGQNSLDSGYFGLLTHIFTTDSLSRVPIAETWGMRYANYLTAEPKLSSENPYRLLSASDHFGSKAKIENPEVANAELQAVTVKAAYWKNALPKYVVMKSGDPTKADFYIAIQEYIPGYSNQMRDFEAQAGQGFVLTAEGHPDLKAQLSGMKLSNGAQYQIWGVRLDAESRSDLAEGVEYSIRPINTSDVYKWSVRPGVVVKAGPE